MANAAWIENESLTAASESLMEFFASKWLPEFVGKKARESYFKRRLDITEFEGCYGRAGWVIVVNGSPPQGTVLAFEQGECFYIGSAHSTRLLGKQKKIVMDFLKEYQASASEATIAQAGNP